MSQLKKQYTFQYVFKCLDCGKMITFPILKDEEDLPESMRDELISQLSRRKKVTWPINPPESEITELERVVPCVRCESKSVIYLWPMRLKT
jgi:hypothetical protein